MSARRVVITGVGLVSPLGDDLDGLMARLYAGESGVVAMPDWVTERGLATGVAAPVTSFDGSTIPRQVRRSMSRVSQMATIATGRAIRDADLGDETVRSPRTGIAYGSTMGGTSAIEEYYRNVLESKSYVEGTASTTFLQIMSHTCAANLAIAFGISGRAIASCVACSASTQSIGFAYEAIKFGLADRMIAGGAEELHTAVAGVFDVLRATSTARNHMPQTTPRPFAKDRDGIVVGEGAGTVVLEEYEAAVKRGAKIYGEVKGFHTNTDARHMTNPSVEGMLAVMKGALADAGIAASEVGYVNAHGTATEVGDQAESRAIEQVVGSRTPVSSLKGHFGHLMGACGVVETIACLGMLRAGRLVQTLNLDTVDDACAELDYVKGAPRERATRYVLKNSLAFGGINASLVLAQVSQGEGA